MPARRTYAKGLAKREEILTSALEVFASQGYLKTSIRELAEAANLSQAGLLHYFGSKEELLVAILQRREEMNTRANQESSQLDNFLRIIRHNVEVPGLVYLFSTMATAASDESHPAHEFFVNRYLQSREGLTADIARRQASGELDPRLDARMLASALIAIADGMQVQWLLDPEIDMSAHIEYLWTLLHHTRLADS